MNRTGAFLALAAMAAAFVPAGAALARPAVRVMDRAAYLTCYRQVLAQPRFAALDPAGLYAIADGDLADAIIAGCGKHLRAYRDQAQAVVKASQKRALADGGTQLPEGMLQAMADIGLVLRIGRDLAEADPRVKPIAEAARLSESH
jgi:hypothetical protein